ncbi:hypothetical protein PROSTU_01212 [Providencia stuartii ATCC 25827]|uniref:Uncharacterized protein n=1 Tax=Providencia stuartii ATCC 25827 TaxID=471874 RepID=A0AA87CVK9_PROST|nr:hypothetical protein PROSTU_01212 [Providencia stuartii ATCC 25827]
MFQFYTALYKPVLIEVKFRTILNDGWWNKASNNPISIEVRGTCR